MAKSGRPAKPQRDLLATWLEAWRFWLLGALLGALLGFAAYQLFPPLYRAQATVVVDHNLEEAWPAAEDRELFQFLGRETERLEELAWSDAVLAAVSEAGGISLGELRSGRLQLSHPSDGGWHFYALSEQPALAQALASHWAESFVAAARAAVAVTPEMQILRTQLNSEAQKADPDLARLRELKEELAYLAEHTKGISPYVELYAAQLADAPAGRATSQGLHLFVGSLVGALLAPLWLTLTPRRPS
ncbi:MAG: hypothetical protein KIT46_04815 [Anaerolineales bacterium]|nr:hypothetical protein [Anaerolineales bacterium]MCW5855353.1 hypothetical protein [Anaerolineales bacterium]